MINKRILILELSEQNFLVLQTLLTKSTYSCEAVLNSESFEKLLPEISQYNLIIVNSHIKYIELNDIMRAVEFDGLKIPVIYIDSSKEHNKNLLNECFNAGIADYIKKPFNSKEITQRVNYHYEQFHKLREYKVRVDKLAHLATIDQLSKLTSKMQMQAILKHKLNYFKRYKIDTILIYLSLVNIDKIIGTFGLEKGERIISQFSKVLKSSIRESDVIARWAGSDFVVLLPNTSISASELIVKKLKTELSSIEMINGHKPELAFGVTDFREDDDIQEILERVKYAFKEAKKQTYGKIHIV